jgi:hypothetical protein
MGLLIFPAPCRGVASGLIIRFSHPHHDLKRKADLLGRQEQNSVRIRQCHNTVQLLHRTIQKNCINARRNRMIDNSGRPFRHGDTVFSSARDAHLGKTTLRIREAPLPHSAFKGHGFFAPGVIISLSTRRISSARRCATSLRRAEVAPSPAPKNEALTPAISACARASKVLAVASSWMESFTRYPPLGKPSVIAEIVDFGANLVTEIENGYRVAFLTRERVCVNRGLCINHSYVDSDAMQNGPCRVGLGSSRTCESGEHQREHGRPL